MPSDAIPSSFSTLSAAELSYFFEESEVKQSTTFHCTVNKI